MMDKRERDEERAARGPIRRVERSKNAKSSRGRPGCKAPGVERLRVLYWEAEAQRKLQEREDRRK